MCKSIAYETAIYFRPYVQVLRWKKGLLKVVKEFNLILFYQKRQKDIFYRGNITQDI